MARRLVLKMSMTVDGYVAGPNGEMDWAARTRDPKGVAWVEETLWQAGAHLLGRRQFVEFAQFWPTAPGPLAAPMNSIPKIAISRGDGSRGTEAEQVAELEAHDPGWGDSRILSGELTTLITALKDQPGKDLLVQGGASFANSLVRLGLIDEYRLVVHPVVLGEGLPLFAGAAPVDLELLSTTTFDSGTVVKIYQPR